MKGLVWYILFFCWWSLVINGQVQADEQTAHLHIVTIDEVPFKVSINGIPQHQEAITSIIIQCIPSPYCLVKIVTTEDHALSIEQTLYLKPFTNYWYELSTKQNRFLPLLYVRESPASTIPVIPKSNQKNREVVVNYKDQAIGQTTLVPLVNPVLGERKSEEYIDLLVDEKNEWNKQKCAHIITEEDWLQWLDKLKVHFFDQEKMAIAKRLISSQCLSKKQFKELLQVFDFEKTRLDVAKFAYHYLNNIVDQTLLKESLAFQSSIDDWTNYVALLSED